LVQVLVVTINVRQYSVIAHRPVILACVRIDRVLSFKSGNCPVPYEIMFASKRN
jgi:hypothetical protein